MGNVVGLSLSSGSGSAEPIGGLEEKFYTYMCMCIYIYMYMYMYREREREIDRDIEI